ncbi:Sulfur carrier protein FdhD [subsurface metagenome]
MSKDSGMEWVEYTKVDAEVTKAKERVVTEFGLSIIVNGRHFATAMITPMMEKEFIIGYLFGQGIIENIADIESITVKDNTAELTLLKQEDKAKRHLRKYILILRLVEKIYSTVSTPS